MSDPVEKFEEVFPRPARVIQSSGNRHFEAANDDDFLGKQLANRHEMRLQGYRAAWSLFHDREQSAYTALQNEQILTESSVESFASPCDAINELITWHVKVATDPKVNGGKVLVLNDFLLEIKNELEKLSLQMPAADRLHTRQLVKQLESIIEQSEPF